MKIKQLILPLILACSLLFSSCKKDDEKVKNPDDSNENEVITSVQLILTNTVNSADKVSAEYNVPGSLRTGLSPLAVQLDLKKNSVYNAVVILLDKSKNPVDTISNAVREEGDEHQFFYNVTGANLTVEYNDFDNNGVPVGLNTIMKTGEASNGAVNVVLKHQGEEKPKSGAGNEAIGSTDVFVSFGVEIE